MQAFSIRSPRTTWISALALLLLAPGLLAAAEHEFPKDYPPTNEIRLENRVAVPMRDGVVLFADVYRPVGDGKYPVIVSRTPYSTERAPNAYSDAVYFSRRGYVYVLQDVRGRHESEGRWEPFRDDEADGYDTIEWAAAQPWSTGKVGMSGGSYLGSVQWRAAQAVPPHLTAIFPRVASTSIYHDWVTVNGGWRLAFNFGWGPVRQESRIMQNTGMHTERGGPQGISYDQMVWHLPLNTMQELAGRNAQFYRDWIAHPDYDDYWKKVSAEEHFDKIKVPVYTMGGFFDIFAQGTLRGFMGVSKKGATEAARKGSNMMIGPWEHGAGQKVGAMDWGPAALPDTHAIELRFFDFWLKGLSNGQDKEPPVKVFVMGRNQWRFENEFPLARTKYRPLYIDSDGSANGSHGNGRLSWSKPNGADADRYVYDPQNPVPSLGGNNCCGVGTASGPQDQRPNEHRGDILVYTSDFIEDEVEIVGPLKAKLWVSSSALDTDFIVRLIDVYPDGRSINIAEGILRMRYREGLTSQKLMEPGETYEVEVDMVGTANLFQKGHRLRLHITSSHFPQFDRNPNAGKAFGTTTDMTTARQAVYHSGAKLSHIIMPVIE